MKHRGHVPRYQVSLINKRQCNTKFILILEGQGEGSRSRSKVIVIGQDQMSARKGSACRLQQREVLSSLEQELISSVRKGCMRVLLRGLCR